MVLCDEFTKNNASRVAAPSKERYEELLVVVPQGNFLPDVLDKVSLPTYDIVKRKNDYLSLAASLGVKQEELASERFRFDLNQMRQAYVQ